MENVPMQLGGPNLRTHVKSIHEGVKYPCDQCVYKATSKGDLRTHVKSIHEGVRYPCDHCDYKVTHKSNLRAHKEYKHYVVTSFP